MKNEAYTHVAKNQESAITFVEAAGKPYASLSDLALAEMEELRSNEWDCPYDYLGSFHLSTIYDLA